MRTLALVVCALGLLAGCATAPLAPAVQVRLDQIAASRAPAAASSGAFVVNDQRDPDMLRTRAAPVGIAGGFSCNIGVEQFGSDLYASDRIARLEAALSTAFPERLANNALVVRRYDIYLNHTAETNAQNVSAGFGGGLIAAAIAPSPDSASPRITRVARCERDRMRHGWFDPVDLTNNNPPITIDIEVTAFGRDYVINSAYSPEIDYFQLGYNYGLETYPTAHGAIETSIQSAMAKAEQRLVQAIAASE